MVGGVDHVVDLGHCVFDGHFDALPQCDLGHAAALATTSHFEKGRVTLDAYQFGETPMEGDSGVDLVFEHLSDTIGDRSVCDTGAGCNGWARRGRVVDEESAVSHGDGGTFESIDTVGANDDREVAKMLQNVFVSWKKKLSVMFTNF